MDFPFDVARVLPNQINIVDNTLILKEWNSTTRNREEYRQLYEIIDKIGESSSFAQGLNRVITTADKLQNSDHTLYLMTEYDDASRRTLVVGLLKVGRKKLFVLDSVQKTHEVGPLCVLDFYIHESRQRRGYGKHLFDYMLKNENLYPGHMALDKPSDKFLYFYERHYNLTKQIPQINNFAIFDTFFMDRPVIAKEAAMTQNRSNRSSRTASPDNVSPISSRRPSQSANAARSGFAGKPSRQRDTNMSDILLGKNESFTPSVRCSNKHHTSLDWMRGGQQSNTTGVYNRTYSASGTPSYSGSPVCRTPRDNTPPASHPGTPPRLRSARDSPRVESPVTTEQTNQLLSDANGQDDETATLTSEMENISVVDGKTGSWRDNIARSTDACIDHMTTKGTTMTGVLNDSESVHGHLKFHHHALW